MADHFPITPPPELIEDWIEIAKPLPHLPPNPGEFATLAARWGADQELEACCEWLHWQNLATHPDLIPSLRAARRPKPPSLKEQALAVVENSAICDHLSPEHEAILRQALEQLDD